MAIKLRLIKGEHIDEQQEKHEAYLKAGFKLERTRKTKDIIIRTYIKENGN